MTWRETNGKLLVSTTPDDIEGENLQAIDGRQAAVVHADLVRNLQFFQVPAYLRVEIGPVESEVVLEQMEVGEGGL